MTGGKQPAGLSFSPNGKMALVANRGDNSISVLSVNGTDVKVTDTVAKGDSVAHVTFAPQGHRQALQGSRSSCFGANEPELANHASATRR